MEAAHAPRAAALDRVVRNYRLIFAISAAVVLAAAVTTILQLLAQPDLFQLPLAALRIGLAVSLLAALAWGYRRISRDVSEAAAEHKQLLDSAHRDALTGAYLRAYFLSELRNALKRAPQVPVGFMQLDMDHLKSINDGLGHAAGDAALLHVIETVRALAPDAVIGRLGGDEFGIALIGQSSRRALLKLGETILDRLHDEVRIGDRMMRLSATIGIAVAPDDGDNVSELIARADLALYRGKKNGRASVVSYDRDMLVDERHQRFVQRELRAALLLGELQVYYQPVVPATGGAPSGYEALIRWHHTHRGVIPPSEFIAIAEQSDMIDRLGELVLRQACADIGVLGAPVAVNVSPVQLRRPGFAASIAAILLETGVPGERLIVEITETVLLGTGVETANLAALRQLGVRIAIDDFGAGHASLQYLRNFRFDIIKIDRSYIAHLTTSKVDRMIVASLCDIARALSVEVIAEGVETPEQLALLAELGCHAVQGYLLGRPVPLALLASPPLVGTAA